MTDLNNSEEIKKVDISNFRQFIVDFPTQFKDGFEIAKGIRVTGEFNKVVVSGMGGSALPVNIFQSYIADYYLKNKGTVEPIVFIPNRYYSLPAESYSRALNILPLWRIERQNARLLGNENFLEVLNHGNWCRILIIKKRQIIRGKVSY